MANVEAETNVLMDEWNANVSRWEKHSISILRHQNLPRETLKEESRHVIRYFSTLREGFLLVLETRRTFTHLLHKAEHEWHHWHAPKCLEPLAQEAQFYSTKLETQIEEQQTRLEAVQHILVNLQNEDDWSDVEIALLGTEMKLMGFFIHLYNVLSSPTEVCPCY